MQANKATLIFCLFVDKTKTTDKNISCKFYSSSICSHSPNFMFVCFFLLLALSEKSKKKQKLATDMRYANRKRNIYWNICVITRWNKFEISSFKYIRHSIELFFLSFTIIKINNAKRIRTHTSFIFSIRWYLNMLIALFGFYFFKFIALVLLFLHIAAIIRLINN